MPPEMNNKEAIQMMQRCVEEIRQLRNRVAALEPKAAAYDDLSTVLRLLPKAPLGYGEDLVWTLQKRIEELQPKPEPAPVEQTAV
jgi:hypothetical protein